MNRLLPALLVVLLQGQPPAPPVPPTRMGLELLTACPLVVVGRTIAARPAGVGTELLHVRVVERLLGQQHRAGDQLSILSPAGQFPFGSEDLLFLRPWRGEERYEVVRRVASAEPHFEAKLSISRRTIWLMEIADVQQRIDATLSLVLDLLRSPDTWVRSQGLDELRWMGERQPDLFTSTRRARVAAAGRTSGDPQVIAGIEAVMSRLQAMDSGLRETAAKEQSPP